ncbi:Methyltransferase-like protein [Nesidiocoris tenuis]|uniref:Methyltransferase-like protein n=1 Tax=Nesidiocoris tenuis TaxID=355587 RepID=A0ABN7AAK5_9HEMI|nr:Methyltransferase-like protein [Nesidiocoris tenuis]
MDLLPTKSFEFSSRDYWEAFFKLRGSNSFEWYGEYEELSSHLHKYMKSQESILIVGCGNSKLSANLYDVGYRHITNIDISSTVIKQMKNLHCEDRPQMVFEEMDALQMTYDDQTFHVVFDKGTLDALMVDDKEETKERVEQYFSEIDRVLRFGGRYIVVSLLQQHILEFVLSKFMEKGWMIRVCRCFDAEDKSFKEQGVKPLPVFIVVLTKFKKLPNVKPIIEFSNTPDVLAARVDDPKKIVHLVLDAQQMAIVCAGLQRSSSAGREIIFEVGKGEIASARYTIYIVDKINTIPKFSGTAVRTYAAFIVPQGRETEWAFGCPEGRQYLVNEAKVDRLAVITLNRGHDFKNMEQVKDELSSIVSDFAPIGLKQGRILFLSMGGDVGQRKEICEGDSPISGKYVVEEVQVDGKYLRRLYFLSAKNIIQSEAKIRIVKTRRGHERTIIDTTSLCCTHHSYMCMGAIAAKKMSQILVIGLGGGSLCSYLRKALPKSVITAVELDPEMKDVAVKYFGLVEDKQLLIYIKDGLEFMKEISDEGTTKYDVVMFDVDNKDIITGLSCPPPSFLEMETLKTVHSILNPDGVFILNLVTRDLKLSFDIRKRLIDIFSTIGSFKLDDDLNEIIYCYPTSTDFSKTITEGSSKFKEIIRQKKLEPVDCIEVTKLMGLLKVDVEKDYTLKAD